MNRAKRAPRPTRRAALYRRTLLMILRMRFEAAEAGVGTIEQHFLGDIVMPNGQTAYGWLQPQLLRLLEKGEMPKQFLLEGPRK